MPKKRVPELDLSSLVFMLLVIFIHVASECVTYYDPASVPFAVMCSAHRLASFVVQGFIFISGVKLFLPRSGEDFSYGKFYLSRFKRTVVPYFIVFVIFSVALVINGRVKEDFPYFIREFLTGGLEVHFYFVFIICQFYLLMPLWRLIAKRCSAFLAIFISLMAMLIFRAHLPEILRLIFGYELTLNSRLFTTFVFYFVCGIFAGQNYDKFTSMLRRHFGEIAALFAVSGVIDCVLIWAIRNKLYYPSWADNFHVIYCTAAILFVMCISQKAAGTHLAESAAVKYITQASYNVYLIHPLFILIADFMLNTFAVSSLTGRFAVKFVTVYPISIGVCVALELILKKF